MTVGASWLPSTISRADIAVILGVSPRVITDWAAKGVLKQAPEKGRYLTLPSIHAYMGALRDSAANRKTESGLSLADERARLTSTERQIAEIKLAQSRGEVLTLTEVSDAWGGLMASVKANMLALPSKARQTLPHLTAHDAVVLKQLCRDLLVAMSEDIEAGVVGADAEGIADDE